MITFGTSGFRGILGDTFTKENVQRIAYGLAQYTKELELQDVKIAIGYDNRFMGEMFAKWMIEVLARFCNVKFFIKPVPTPIISFATYNCDFGVMVTSSHNPFYYNGVKIFGKNATELSDDEAEKMLKYSNEVSYKQIKTIDYVKALEEGKVEKTLNVADYKASILKLVDVEKLTGSKIKVLVNSMHGSSIDIIKEMCVALDLKHMDFMNAEVDPYFENGSPVPYAKNLIKQSQKVVLEGYTCGIAIDGDGDRFTLIDCDGKVFDCSFVSCLLYDYLINKQGKKGAIVKNLALTNMANKIAEANGEQCVEVFNGFKHIGEAFNNNECVLGAETNGVAFAEHVKSKDGIATCFVMLSMLVEENKSFHDLLQQKQKELKFVSCMEENEYEISAEKREIIASQIKEKNVIPVFDGRQIKEVKNDEGLKIIFENDYWCMLRLSGTEPKVRIFVEAENEENCFLIMEKMEKEFDIMRV